MKTHPLPNLWASPHGFLHRDRMLREAAEQAAAHPLPMNREELSQRLRVLRDRLSERFHLGREDSPLDLQIHGEIPWNGYKIQKISFASSPQIRVTGNLYIPDGQGPFPAVLNMHGHWDQGKLAARVQARGHALAQNGIVTLTVDAAGSGERAEEERRWSYHGAAKAGELFLSGDSLMGVQLRDNGRALDLLQSLAYVASDKLGATGASGGGNQTMWLAAMDERVQAAVPVVSVGSFQAYVGACNCMCETLPGGLKLAEEWMVLGLIAPRALLIINALHDQASFAYGPMSSTCRQVEEIYALHGAGERFDSRLIDMTHGYWPVALRAMVGWMKGSLAGGSGQPENLPDEQPLPEEDLVCFSPGQRPEACGYQALRKAVDAFRQVGPGSAELGKSRSELARRMGWKPPTSTPEWLEKRILDDGIRLGAVLSPRNLPLPVAISRGWKSTEEELRLILSPKGKNGAFSSEAWRAAAKDGIVAVAADLPAVGELAWEAEEVAGDAFHNSARAALWLGYTLVGEWAEAVAALCLSLRAQVPQARIHVVAEEEMVFAALLAQTLSPCENFSLTESKCPNSLRDPKSPSLAWYLPDFLSWGDLEDLRDLAGSPESGDLPEEEGVESGQESGGGAFQRLPFAED